MKREEVLELIKGGETQEVELKETCPGNHDISKAICSFANSDGGFLILGVSRSGEVKGLRCDIDKLQQDISNANQRVVAPPLISTSVHKIEQKTVVVVEIARAQDRNAHTFDGVVYVRIGSTVRKLDGQSLFDFLKNRQILCFDEQDSEAQMEDLDSGRAQVFLGKRDQPDFLKTHSLKDFLLSNMLARENRNLRIKNVASLFFAKEPQKWHPQNEVRVAKFSGTEPINVVAQQDFHSDPIENIEQVIAFVRQNTSKRFIIPEGSPRRVEVEEYPMAAVREAVVNSVAHRDYYSYDAIQVSMFDDRMEVSSPGGLPTGLTREFFGRRSVRRNPLSYRLLRDCRYVEGLGTGIPRMINEMRRYGLRDPEFHFETGFFVVVLRNVKSMMKPVEGVRDLNERQMNSLHYLRQNKTIKSRTYANINSVSLPIALKDLAELIKFKYVKKVGTYRGAYYILDEERLPRG